MEVAANSPYSAIELLSPVATFLIAPKTAGTFCIAFTGSKGLTSPCTSGVFGVGCVGLGGVLLPGGVLPPGVVPPGGVSPPPPGFGLQLYLLVKLIPPLFVSESFLPTQ